MTQTKEVSMMIVDRNIDPNLFIIYQFVRSLVQLKVLSQSDIRNAIVGVQTLKNCLQSKLVGVRVTHRMLAPEIEALSAEMTEQLIVSLHIFEANLRDFRLQPKQA